MLKKVKNKACAKIVTRRNPWTRFYSKQMFDYVRNIIDSKVYEVAHETDLQYANSLSKKTGNRVYLKREDQQPVFSFKLRGAYNKMANLSPEQRSNGVCACSAGNHAQGVAYSAARLKISAKIFMPVTTPSIKVDAVKRFSNGYSDVILIGSSYDEAYAATKECQAREKRSLIHPFDDPFVIAGQGTIGMEIIKQCTDENLHAIFCCVGGGGLISGVGTFMKAIKPGIKVIGVEAADAAGMSLSLERGEVSILDQVGIFADGAAVKKIGSRTFAICQDVVDEMITVSTDEICSAIKDGFEDTRIILEPAGALAVAGMKQYIQKHKVRDRTMIAIASGANMDFTRLRFVSERADQSESLVKVTLSEKPGALRRLYELIYPRNVTEFSYRVSEPRWKTDSAIAHICMSIQMLDSEDLEIVKKNVEDEGMTLIDLSTNELAKVHGRHLVGGRAPVGLQNERLVSFEFPERPGALRKFLNELPSEIDISLFHYRNHGADVGRVLIGFIVSEDRQELFYEFVKRLDYPWTEETENVMYKEFLSEHTEFAEMM